MPWKRVISVIFTLLVFTAAVLLVRTLWLHYMDAAWTRDGRVRAEVVNIAPDVAGLVVEVAVHDNQTVHKGDLLLRIDAEHYRTAVLEAQARLDEARLQLKRTEVRAPVDGYITNLNVFEGDFANRGEPAMALVDRHSFYVYGYFEETRLPLIRVGDKAQMRLMSGEQLSGQVDSFARGIYDRDNPESRELIADVNPTFNWVRLAQRVPVRIDLDALPEGLELAAGMTCTVIITPPTGEARAVPLRW